MYSPSTTTRDDVTFSIDKVHHLLGIMYRIQRSLEKETYET